MKFLVLLAKVYFPLILNPAFLMVMFTPSLFWDTFLGEVVIKFSKEILYITRSCMSTGMSVLFNKSLGSSIFNLLSHSLRYKSEGFLFVLYRSIFLRLLYKGLRISFDEFMKFIFRISKKKRK